MKSKKLIFGVVGSILLILFIATTGLHLYAGVFGDSIKTEAIENQFPDQVDVDDALRGPSWVTLPYGYTLGPWPTRFHEAPIVMKLTYQKGPPQKFIQQMTQVWDPINAELSLEGPKTPVAEMQNKAWKKCFSASYRCLKSKKKFYNLTLQDLEKWKSNSWKVTWFESLDPLAPKGIHARLELPKFIIDRFVVITEQGVTQNFTLKTIREPIGLEAQLLFYKILGAMKVKDDLSNARAWIQAKLQSVKLTQTQQITSPKLKYARLILIQNELFSQLSVNPTQVAPFFHLAGVTHLLAVNLLKNKVKAYEQQDAWLNQSQPLLDSILKYVKDFPNSTAEEKNIESLLQDLILLEQKLSN